MSQATLASNSLPHLFRFHQVAGRRVVVAAARGEEVPRPFGASRVAAVAQPRLSRGGDRPPGRRPRRLGRRGGQDPGAKLAPGPALKRFVHGLHILWGRVTRVRPQAPLLQGTSAPVDGLARTPQPSQALVPPKDAPGGTPRPCWRSGPGAASASQLPPASRRSAPCPKDCCSSLRSRSCSPVFPGGTVGGCVGGSHQLLSTGLPVPHPPHHRNQVAPLSHLENDVFGPQPHRGAAVAAHHILRGGRRPAVALQVLLWDQSVADVPARGPRRGVLAMKRGCALATSTA